MLPVFSFPQPHASSAGDDSASGNKSPKIHQFSRDSTVFQSTTLSNATVIGNQETSPTSPTATQRGELDRPLTMDDLWSRIEDTNRPPDPEERVFPVGAAVRHIELQQRKRQLLDASRRYASSPSSLPIFLTLRVTRATLY